MRIGIGLFVRGGLFDSGTGQTALFLYKAFEACGVEVVLVDLVGNGSAWWPDHTTLRPSFRCIPAADVQAAGLDLYVDIDGITAPALRELAAKRCAVLFRGNPAFDSLEQSTYIRTNAAYTLKGVSEVWVWDAMVSAEDVSALETLFGDRPVVRVPFTWSPMCLGVATERGEGDAGDVGNAADAGNARDAGDGYTLVIASSNRGSSASCVLPLIAAAGKDIGIPVERIRILNATNLATNAYFQRNIVKNMEMIESLEHNIDYCGRIPYSELNSGNKTIVLTHLRFQPFRAGLMDLMWLGIPFVHNSPLLRDAGFTDNYYTSNNVEELKGCVRRICGESGDLAKRRHWAETAFAPATVASDWHPLLATTPIRQLPIPLAGSLPRALGRLSSPSPSSPARETFRIGFTDMWEGFDPTDNWFLDLVRNTIPVLEMDSIRVEGVDGLEEDCNVLLFGPFGLNWESVDAKTPKIFFSGERVDPVALIEPRVSLFMTHSLVEDEKHMRVPLWLMFLDWFTGQPHLQRNPNSLPWEWAVKGDTKRIEDSKFCAFVVSNPNNPVRNAAFEALNAYRRVSSGGAYMNNIGGPIHHMYGGGGGGDVAKHAFLKDHTYSICYENSSAPGYVTEKLLHAKLAGCVPLYWGADASVDFDSAGFLQFTGSESDLVEAVRRLEADPVQRKRIAETPALDAKHLQKAKDTLMRVAQAILELGGAFRKQIGMSTAGVSGAREARPVNGTEAESKRTGVTGTNLSAERSADPVIQQPLFVTFATAKYLPSLELALKGWKALGVEVIVWLGHDVSESQEAALQSSQKIYREGVTYRRLPVESPVTGFPDFWEPNMFGWKTWLLQEICRDERLAGRTIIYSDAGAVWVEIPRHPVEIAQKEGVCLFIDREEINRHWCTAEMVNAMSVTEKELEQNQLMACFQVFVAGHPVANRLYTELFTWASRKECLFGPYLSGTDASGNSIGHRHDQSILGILALRQRIACMLGNSMTCMTSLRKTYQRGASVYLHRGNYAGHRQVLPGVDDVWNVNLDRRKDRWDSWLTAHPSLQPFANRLPAIDGKALQLTPALERLFAGNDFHWKKSVVGCALSHIILWAQLVCEHPSVKNYLILEDDHRFKDPAWADTFAVAMAAAPPDAELLYFGGVLPGNRALYGECIEPVNEVWATIKPTPYFTGGKSLAPIFHFCTYSYLLTRKGAEKLLAVLRTQGCRTSIDHFLGWPEFGLKKYVMQDLLASCFQDEDPAYVNSAFDDMKRVDTFDSDIWNNPECFALETEKGVESSPDLWQCIVDVLQQAPHSIQTQKTLRQETVNGIQPMPAFYYKTGTDKHDGQMEGPWLKELFPGLTTHPYSLSNVLQVPLPWLIVARPNMAFWSGVCTELDRRGKPYCLLHLSDELGSGHIDSIDLYKSPFCKKVVRNYLRPDIVGNPKVSVIPLGYAVKSDAACALPEYTKREYVWSFHGTRWFEREAQLAPLATVGPNSCKWQDDFLHPSMTPPAEYSRLLLQSRFVPVPRGNNTETFRLYEALEHGCIPLYVRTAGDDTYWQWLRGHLELVELVDWSAARRLIEHLQKSPDAAEQYRRGLQTQWQTWKAKCKRITL